MKRLAALSIATQMLLSVPVAAGAVDASDRERFREIVETELLSLHEGNFARYQIRSSEFAAWREVWNG